MVPTSDVIGCDPITLDFLKRDREVKRNEKLFDIASRRKRMAMRQIQLAIRLGYDF